MVKIFSAGIKILTPLLVLLLFIPPNLANQDQSILAQKLMLENTIRMRIIDALETLLQDSRFVVDVKVELEFKPLQRQESVIRPTKGDISTLPSPSTAVEESVTAPGSTQKPAVESFEILPGIPVYTTPEQGKPEEKRPETVTQAPSAPTTEGKAPEIISQSFEQVSLSLPKIKRMEINLILEQGLAPEIIDNIRRVVEIASQFDRSRGDVINIMSSSFRQKSKEPDIDQVYLKTIAEKIDRIEKQQQEQAKKAELEERLRREKAAARQDSQRIALLQEEINRLKMQLLAGNLNQQEKEQKVKETEARQKELEQLKSQLEESNKRLAELEKGLIEEGRKQFQAAGTGNIYFIIAGVTVALLLLLLILWLSQRARVQKADVQWQQPYQPMAPPTTPTPPAIEGITPSPEKKEESAPSVKKKIAKTEVREKVDPKELQGLKQSVVTLSVGQPDKATSIIKEWLSGTPTEESSESETEGV